MTYFARLRPEAVDDIDRESAYYDGEQLGLGLTFVDAVFAAVDRISEFPEKHRYELDDVCVALASPFPFGVFFYVRSEDVVVVIAVADLRTEPRARLSALRARRDS